MESNASPDDRIAPPPPSCRGRHLICELYGAQRLHDREHVGRTLRRAAEACGATVLETRLHPFDDHGGITGVVLLAESHVTIHTWPEHAYAAVDLFMCGDCDPADGVPVLEDAFKPDTTQRATFDRGRPPTR
jgi:S-adenosylmethionine decarboxylase